MLRHFRNPQLLATYAVGFGVLFNFIATFTYISFRLAAPPYNFSPTALGAIFVVYLVGSAHDAAHRHGGRPFRAPPLHDRRHRAVDRRHRADAARAAVG